MHRDPQYIHLVTMFKRVLDPPAALRARVKLRWLEPSRARLSTLARAFIGCSVRVCSGILAIATGLDSVSREPWLEPGKTLESEPSQRFSCPVKMESLEQCVFLPACMKISILSTPSIICFVGVHSENIHK